MCRVILTLVLIRLRKFLPKNDNSAIILFLFFLIGFYFIFYKFYDEMKVLGFLFFLDPLLYHMKRKDLALLKESKHFTILLFTEYLLYIFPAVIIFLLKGEVYALLSIVYVFILTFVKQFKTKPIVLPFKLFEPLWHICFRKYKGYLLQLFSILILCIGIIKDNDNVVYFAILISLLFPVMIYFEEDNNDFVVYSKYYGRDFINKQIAVYLINLLLFNSLFLVIYILVLHDVDKILLLLGIYLYSSTVVVCKYYTNNLVFRAFLFGILVGGMSFGTFLLIPFFYIKDVRNIEKIQC